jgi:hypothetical protein
MSADIFTKHFTDKTKWTLARRLIGHYSPEEVYVGFGVSQTQTRRSCPAIAALLGHGVSQSKHTRIIIEFCCGPKSKLGIKTCWSKGCLVIRVTLAMDATRKETINSLIQIIKSAKVPVMLFSSQGGHRGKI